MVDGVGTSSSLEMDRDTVLGQPATYKVDQIENRSKCARCDQSDATGPMAMNANCGTLKNHQITGGVGG